MFSASKLSLLVRLEGNKRKETKNFSSAVAINMCLQNERKLCAIPNLSEFASDKRDASIYALAIGREWRLSNHAASKRCSATAARNLSSDDILKFQRTKISTHRQFGSHIPNLFPVINAAQ
jgi:hypothetical protein